QIASQPGGGRRQKRLVLNTRGLVAQGIEQRFPIGPFCPAVFHAPGHGSYKAANGDNSSAADVLLLNAA
ncbi:MAG TPA: hypothetical protein VIO16_07505, partial [Dehalococcoidia bacterium]